jgi:16S rRNA (adenine1518-N6/adenine1519-N6)-dimethyltransferase
MNSLLKNTQSLLKKHSLNPSKRLGQNFMVDRSAIKRIIDSAEISQEDNIIEIGPGTGILTKELANKAKKVVAIEKDIKLAEILKENLNKENVEIISRDVLEIDDFCQFFSNSKNKEYKIVANLPYYITSYLIRKVLGLENPPQKAILVMQKEVGQRICQLPPRMNLLAVSVQLHSRVNLLGYISKDSFWPKPKVEAAIVKLEMKKEKLKTNQELFFKIVKAGFSQPRKRLDNNLSKELKLEKEKIADYLRSCNILPGKRAESLSLEDWVCLTDSFAS